MTGETVPDPSVLTTEQLVRETGQLSKRMDRQGSQLTKRLDRHGKTMRAVDHRVDGLDAHIAGLAAKQDGDIRRLAAEIEWSNRSVDSAQVSHQELHNLNDKHVDIAREQQQLRNETLNNERARQNERDSAYAQKETVNVEVSAIRAQIDRNDTRIRELELALRGVLAEDTGAASSKRSGQATVQQLAAVVGSFVAIIAIIVTIVIANISTSV